MEYNSALHIIHATAEKSPLKITAKRNKPEVKDICMISHMSHKGHMCDLAEVGRERTRMKSQ